MITLQVEWSDGVIAESRYESQRDVNRIIMILQDLSESAKPVRITVR